MRSRKSTWLLRITAWVAVWGGIACGSDDSGPRPDASLPQQEAGASAGSAVPPSVAGAGSPSAPRAGTGGVSGRAPTGTAAAGMGAARAGAGGRNPGADDRDAGPSDAATPEDAAASDAGMGPPSAPGYLRTQGSKIVDSANRVVRITGINWFGMETSNFAPHGLWMRSLASLLDQIKTLGYNTLRLPYCSQLFDPGSQPNGIDASKNSDLVGISGLGLMDKIVMGAKSRGLKVILDRHRPDSNMQSELWYTSAYSEQRLIDDWKMLVQHYKNEPTVIGVDLHNEPHGAATWGDGNMATDWRLAAERIGNAVLSVNPNLLIIVEGVEKYQNTPGWWGGNLRGAKAAPVRLSVANRLVYSAHDYPQSVYAQPWFMAADYPSNLPSVWDDAWGYLVDENIAPVWVGEFGTKYQTDADKKWLQALVGYLKERGFSFAYWSLNPNSGDTGGILQDDWMTVNQDKQSILQPALAPLLP